MPRFFLGLLAFILVGLFALSGAFMATGPLLNQPVIPHEKSGLQGRSPR